MTGSGPFRGLAAYDEAAADLFFGRAPERAAAVKMITAERFRLGLLTGAPGIGKTSFARAALIPHLSREGMTALYLADHADLERGLGRLLAPLAGPMGASGDQDTAALLGRVAGQKPLGALLVLDHLDVALTQDGAGRLAEALGHLMFRVARGEGHVRFLVVADSTRLGALTALEKRLGAAIPPASRFVLGPLEEPQATEVIERTVVACGTAFEQNLASTLAHDLTEHGPIAPWQLQLACKAAIDLRVVNLARYRRLGGADALSPLYLQRTLRAVGRQPALRLLAVLCDRPAFGAMGIEELARAAFVSAPLAQQTAEALERSGLLRKQRAAGLEGFALAHEVLAEALRDHVAALRQKMAHTRLILHRRTAQQGWLRPHELRLVRRYSGGALNAEQHQLLRRSIRLFQAVASGVVLGVVALFGLLYMRVAHSYVAQLERGRVVVRLSQPSRLFRWIPHAPAFGAVLGDSGISAQALTAEARTRFTRGLSGTVDPAAPSPDWLRQLLLGLRPPLRAFVLTATGAPEAKSALRMAFREPATRAELLDVLEAVGRGDEAECEVLRDVLRQEEDLDLRRRAIEVAAAIETRHAGACKPVLAAALQDKAPGLGRVALAHLSPLPLSEQGQLLEAALASPREEVRTLGASAIEALAAQDLASALAAVEPMGKSTDPATRRAAHALVDKLLSHVPAEQQAHLEKVADDDAADESLRIAALAALRRRPTTQKRTLSPLIEQAARGGTEALRVAALPLLARTADPEKALAAAAQAQTGSPALRAASAAAYGELAARGIAAAATPLRTLASDANAEVRAEATRAAASLGKEVLPLLEHASRDSATEVERAAVDGLVQVAHANPYGAAGVLDKMMTQSRASLRPSVLEAFAKVGVFKPYAATGPLEKVLKSHDAPLRIAAVATLCTLGKNAPSIALERLGSVARDPDVAIRQRVAACAQENPALAGKLGSILALDVLPGLRAAAASALGAAKSESALLAQLMADKDRNVRLSALHALSGTGGPKDPERKLAAAWTTADAEEKAALIDVARAAGATGLLRTAADDHDADVRRSALAAAATLGDAGFPLLHAALADPDGGVRLAAMKGLMSLGAKATRALPTLERLVLRTAPEERLAALSAMAAMGPAGLEVCTRQIGWLLEDPSEAIRTAAAQAAEAAATQDDRRIVPLLERAVGDVAYDVRRAAIVGLAAAYARTLSPAELGKRLLHSEAEASSRLALLEALFAQLRAGSERASHARQILEHIAQDRKSPVLARTSATLVLGGRGEASGVDRFLARLFGG